ncbi:MAG: (2Fe-2S)-binding protein [Herminiimonas sp.]|nr:(2Fe-2S)-binding protein [Herminiimonas sp.]MDB5855497.1 (2Fe-2S)-binding protein [Herminiimonas sp.]
MPRAVFVTPRGEEHSVEVAAGLSLMEGARDEDIPGIIAECGGGAICGTCHVRVDPEWYALLQPSKLSETALLEAVPEGSATSRLACQIVMSERLDGIRVQIPSEQLAF